MSALAEVQRLQIAAKHVTRHLPEAHVVTRWYRELRFRAAANRFLRLLYDVDVPALGDEELLAVENLARVALKSVEIHVLLKFGQADTSECQYYADLIVRLRDAISGMENGFSADPRRRPTHDEMLDSLARDLEAIPAR